MPDSRYLLNPIIDDGLNHRKMAFITGPRQVGKTTLAKEIGKKNGTFSYWNWDDSETKKVWATQPKSLLEHTSHNSLIIFDEIHKDKRWRNTLKGLYDAFHESNLFVVTGSARLDTLKRGGDSLMGRQFTFRLHPYSVRELTGKPNTPDLLTKQIKSPTAKTSKAVNEAYELLTKFGGFPDPFHKQSERYRKMWSRGRLEKIVRQDLFDLTRVHDLSQFEVLALMIKERVGSLLSYHSISEDMQVNEVTIKQRLKDLECVYWHYLLPPLSKNVASAIKKAAKSYLWDWSEVADSPARLENMVVSHLLKAAHYWSDLGYGEFDLRFIRDKLQREVDLVLLKDNTPWLLVEIKSHQTALNKPLVHFRKNWPKALAVQLVDELDYYRYHKDADVSVISVRKFLAELV